MVCLDMRMFGFFLFDTSNDSGRMHMLEGILGLITSEDKHKLSFSYALFSKWRTRASVVRSYLTSAKHKWKKELWFQENIGVILKYQCNTHPPSPNKNTSPKKKKKIYFGRGKMSVPSFGWNLGVGSVWHLIPSYSPKTLWLLLPKLTRPLTLIRKDIWLLGNQWSHPTIHNLSFF